MVHVCILSFVPRPPCTAFVACSTKALFVLQATKAVRGGLGTKLCTCIPVLVWVQSACISSISSLIHYRTLMQSSQRKWRPWLHFNRQHMQGGWRREIGGHPSIHDLSRDRHIVSWWCCQDIPQGSKLYAEDMLSFKSAAPKISTDTAASTSPIKPSPMPSITPITLHW